jgi:hypothetical protein
MKVVNGVQIISLDMDAQTWNVILAGLNELPRKISDAVVQNLQAQVVKQVSPPQGKPPAPIEANDTLPVA